MRERKFVWLVSKYQVPPLFCETQSLLSLSLRVSHRSMVWLRLLVSCTYPLGPYISVSEALISNFWPLPLFAWEVFSDLQEWFAHGNGILVTLRICCFWEQPSVNNWWEELLSCVSAAVTLRRILYTAIQNSPVGLSSSWPQQWLNW